MHETALLRDLRSKLVEVATTAGTVHLTRVQIGIGALAHLTEARLRAEWPDLVAGTPAEGATLVIRVGEDPTEPRAQAVVLESVTVLSETPDS